jgi:hypothetical protein
VGRRSVEIHVRAVAQRGGGTNYAVDQLSNPYTVVFRPGGMHSETTVIAGMVGTVNDAPTGTELMKIFTHEIKCHFSRVRDYWVGPDAFHLLQGGARLTSSASAPSEFDLKLEIHRRAGA